ncbi:MAG: ATP phosphoribosyltransferase [Spirochaetia bacterium]|jgi:ATP phosphoribosyltransferase|nr:ATP phosphoribosyltransferase [Spirochaetia bacterium]
MIQNNSTPLSLALPKGRLMEDVSKFFGQKGLSFSFDNRKLVSYDESGNLKIFLVKNSDLPTYVNHGIAGLGICGSDVLYESGYKFFNLMTFDFGGTSMCIAGKKGHTPSGEERKLSVATKFTKFTSDYFHKKGIPVEIVKLNGSVELAPVLGLTPYIVDLVETGNTLKANNLEVLEKLEDIKVHLIANPAYYKLHYKSIKKIVSILKER